MQTLGPSLGIWILKSSAFSEKRLSDETAIGQLKMISASVPLGRFGTLDEIAKLLCMEEVESSNLSRSTKTFQAFTVRQRAKT